MRNLTTRNILAALLILAGTAMVAVSPVGAEETQACVDVTVTGDSAGLGPLTKNVQVIGPLPVNVAGGTYEIVLSSADPTHAPGAYLDQVNEQWHFTLDSGYVSPVTPDIPDEAMGTSMSAGIVTLAPASSITFHWDGVLPSYDSVHPTVSFICATAPTTTTTTTVAPTTAPTTTVAPTTTTAPTTSVAPSSTVAPTTTVASTTTTQGEIGGITEENPQTGEELARTGLNLTLGLTGLTLILLGSLMVGWESLIEVARRRLVPVERR